MSRGRGLRVLDFGRASALRSQSLWHAVAYGVSDGAPPTLSFVRPSEPYVCLGYHRRLEEVDVDRCRELGLPVLRRMVGGGPVYLDDGQLFFQVTLPVADVSPARAEALRTLLSPAVTAFRRVGVPASLDEASEIVVGDRKVSGHGAGQIERVVVVVANLIERFDHERTAAVLRAPDEAARAEALRLMRRYVAATPADPERFKDAAVRAYADALGLEPEPGELTAAERERLPELDELLADPVWVRGPERPSPGVWRLKVRAGVWVFVSEELGARALVSVVRGRVERAHLSDPELNGEAPAMARRLEGLALEEVEGVLRELGGAGDRLAAAVAKAGDGRDM